MSVHDGKIGLHAVAESIRYLADVIKDRPDKFKQSKIMDRNKIESLNSQLEKTQEMLYEARKTDASSLRREARTIGSQKADPRYVSHQVDPRNGIFLKDGQYHVWVMIQDGHEKVGVYDTPEEAEKHWFSAQKVYNGNTPERLGPVVIYEVVQVPEPTFKYRKVN